jgi:hypothetical protein
VGSIREVKCTLKVGEKISLEMPTKKTTNMRGQNYDGSYKQFHCTAATIQKIYDQGIMACFSKTATNSVWC